MKKIPLTYTNFNGVQVTKDFYFNLTEAEIALRELESDNTFSQILMYIKGSNKGSEVLPWFREIVKWTYGEKSSDGEFFDKTPEAWGRFENTEPWSMLIMKLLTEDGFSSDFINGIMPPGLLAKAQEQNAVPGFRPGADTSRPTPPVAEQPQPAPPVYQEPVQPQYQPSQTPAPIQDVPENPTWNNPPVIPGGYTEGATQPDDGVERTSAPRDWTPPAPPQN